MRHRLLLAHALFVTGPCALAAPASYHIDGHIKGRYAGQQFPADSVFNDLAGRSSHDIESDLRLNFEADTGAWSVRGAWQLFALYGDSVEYSRQLPPLNGFAFDRLPNDSRRLFDLSWTLEDSGKLASLHRIDRVSLGYTGDKAVLRVGRQAISWGNGLFFSPMDIVNPFDPTTIDTEFKTGDDMVYGQYLLDSGNDIQGAYVARRNPVTGSVEAAQSTASLKYHGVLSEGEFDLLVAQNYGDTTVGVGGNRSVGGAVWRADLVVADASDGWSAQIATSVSYSWMWGGKNVTGAAEYYYNGYGQPNGDYENLANNPELLKRLARGEVFSLGRHYFAGAVTVELTPLWTVTPTLFTNLEDPSAFFQLITQYSLGDNTVFLGSVNVPIGPSGSEYGGISSGLPDRYLSTDIGVFAQFAWYF